MTSEEALEILKSIEILSFRDKKRKYFMADVWKAKKVAIKALEQQPCEDCISREAVKEMLSEEWTKYMPMELDINLSFVLEKINELPSVTPTRPNGKWKRISPAGIYECTNCNQVIMTSDIDCYKYCHGCGVRMEGEE